MGNTPTQPVTPSLIGTTGGGSTPVITPSNVPTTSNGQPNYGALNGIISSNVNGTVTMWDYAGLQPGQVIFYDYGPAKHKIDEGYGTPHSAPSEKYTTRGIQKASVQEIYNNIASLSFTDQAKFLAIQQALNNGNWGTVVPSGRMDDATQHALGMAIKNWSQMVYNTDMTSVPFTQFLLGGVAGGSSFPNPGSPGSGGSGSTHKPPVVRVTDPSAIATAAQSAAESALGRSLTADQLHQFVSEFQNQQKHYQLDAYNAASSGVGATVASPDLRTEALAYAEQADPQAYNQDKRTAYMDALARILGDSTAPSMPTPPPSVDYGQGQGQQQNGG